MSYTFSRLSFPDTEQQPPPKMESHPPLPPPRPVSRPPHVLDKLTEQAGCSPRPGRALVPKPGSVLPGTHTGKVRGDHSHALPASRIRQPLHPPSRLPQKAHLQPDLPASRVLPPAPACVKKRWGEGGRWSPCTSTFDAPHFPRNENAPSCPSHRFPVPKPKNKNRLPNHRS